MNFFRKIWYRTVQGILRLATAVMPLKRPILLNDCAEAGELAKSEGKSRALLVTGPVVRSHGLLEPVIFALSAFGISYEIYDKTPANPTISAIEEAFALYCAAKCDMLIAVGGGSPMDCAKGVCARIIKPKKTILQMKGVLKVRGKQPLFLAIPTTAGTGSEATVAAVVTDDKTHRKFTMISFCLAPKYALLDPVMTKTLPPAPTAETGLDALTHAVEAYIGRSTTRTTRRLAVSAVKRIKENLLTAYEHGNDLTARKEMQLAAYEAGLAITASYVGYVHAVAHSLGGAYNYPHGRTNATLLPIVLKFYGKACQQRLAKLARESGVSMAKQDSLAAEEFIRWIESLNRALHLPETVEIAERDIPVLAKHADAEANSFYPVPKLMSAKELQAIYRTARTQHVSSD